jgi:hypothetical protein
MDQASGHGATVHSFGWDDAPGFGSTHASRRMRSPPVAVAGCIHDTYPMIATCTMIRTRTTVAAVNALARAMLSALGELIQRGEWMVICGTMALARTRIGT